MSDERRRVEEINETDLEPTTEHARQRSARNDPGMRDGDDSHGNPLETWADNPREDSDADVGDTTALTSEEFGVLDAVPANEPAEPAAEEPPSDEAEPGSGGPISASRPPDRPAVPESRRTRPDIATESESDTERDRDEPLANYSSLTIPQIFEKLRTLSPDEVRAVRDYEKSHRRRKTLLVKLERQLRPHEASTRAEDRSRP
jgi:hypothetical protein